MVLTFLSKVTKVIKRQITPMEIASLSFGKWFLLTPPNKKKTSGAIKLFEKKPLKFISN